jgi:hypothetical protein
VITPYEEINHQGEDFDIPLLLAYTAATITKQESAEIVNPNAIFAGVDGSFPLPLKNEKNATTNGVNKTTQKGFTD